MCIPRLMGKLSEDNQGPDKFEVLAPREGVYDTVSIAKMPAIQSESDKYIYITKFQKKGNRIEPKWNTVSKMGCCLTTTQYVGIMIINHVIA